MSTTYIRHQADVLDTLSPRERAAEEKALAEERAKLAWLSQSPEQLTERIPNSVFALGATLVGA